MHANFIFPSQSVPSHFDSTSIPLVMRDKDIESHEVSSQLLYKNDENNHLRNNPDANANLSTTNTYVTGPNYF